MSRVAVETVRDVVRGLSSPERNVMRELAWWHDKDTGTTYRAQGDLAHDCELEQGNVSRILARLVGRGVLLTVTPASGRRAALYRIPAVDAARSTVPAETAEPRSLVAGTLLRPTAGAAAEVRSNVLSARSIVAGTAKQEIEAGEEKKEKIAAADGGSFLSQPESPAVVTATPEPTSPALADSTVPLAVEREAAPTAERPPSTAPSRATATPIRRPLPTGPAAAAPSRRPPSAPRRIAATPRPDADWFDECKVIHGGACGLNRYAHAVLKMCDAQRAADAAAAAAADIEPLRLVAAGGRR